MRLAVLHDDYPPDHEGGSGVIAKQLAEGFAALGHTVCVICNVSDPRRAGREREGDVEVVRIHAGYDTRWRAYRSLWNPPAVRAVDQALAAFKPDIVHAHNVHLYLSYASLAVAKKHARALFMTAHDTMAICHGKLPDAKAGTLPPGVLRESWWEQVRTRGWQYNPLRTFFIRRILRRCVDGVIPVSRALATALAVNGIDSVEVIHNGIDADAWREPGGVAAFAQKHRIGGSAVLFGGRLSAAKGAYQALEALACVIKTVPNAQLLIIGKEDAVKKRMYERARMLGITSRLVFTEWLSGEALRRAYYASAVVAVPSLYLDPFPTVNLEALACKKPVVATCFGGSPEIVMDGVNGYIINPLDTNELAARIVNLLTDRTKRERFGEAGYKRVAKEFSLTRQVAAYELLFMSALN